MFDSPMVPINPWDMGLYYDQYPSHEISDATPLFMSNLDGMWDDSFEPDVRQPPYPSSNRFEILADHALETYGAQEYVPDFAPRTRNHSQRPRNSRGTKEGKRRRDARRKKAKYDAQKLDEQLTRQLDDLIKSVAVHQHASYSPLASPVTTLDAVRQTPNRLRRTPVSPAQLSYPLQPDFTEAICYFPEGPFRKASCPATEPLECRSHHTSFSDNTHAPHLDVYDIWLAQLSGMQAQQPSGIAGSLPSWCPTLPVFNRSNLWQSGQPVFHDLSALPEPSNVFASDSKPQDMQIWRPRFEKRRSRFFPSRTGSHFKVKLPSRAPVLGTQNNWTKNDVRSFLSTNSKLVDFANSMDHVASTADVNSKDADAKDSSAANLWNILESQYQPHPSTKDLPQLSSLDCENKVQPYATSFDANAEAAESCFELVNTAVPYTHANSLLGVANETATLPYAFEHGAIVESAIYLSHETDNTSPLIGMNELLVDYDVYNHSSQSGSEALRDIAATATAVLASGHPYGPAVEPIVMVAYTTDADGTDHVADETHLQYSDAHYCSEKELFALPSPPATPAEESPIDVAAFLSMGHGRTCWCQDCEDVPELISADSLNGDEDEWTVCTPDSEDDGLVDEVTSPTSQSRCDQENRDVVETGKPWADMDFFQYLLGTSNSNSRAVLTPEDRYRLRGGSEADWIFDCEV